MGQRSQIYLKIDKKLVMASYFSWNYGERMISRARHGIEYIKSVIDNYPSLITDKDYIEKIRRIFDINFDMKDVAISLDILKEWEKDKTDDFFQGETFCKYVFHNQPNNDGKLFVYVDTEKSEIKYALTDWVIKKTFTPSQYMSWDYSDWKAYFKENNMEEELLTFEDNAKTIKKLAKRMTLVELHFYMKEAEETYLKESEDTQNESN